MRCSEAFIQRVGLRVAIYVPHYVPLVCFHVRRPLKSNKTGPISIRIYPAKRLTKAPLQCLVVLAKGSCGEEMLREIGKGTYLHSQ